MRTDRRTFAAALATLAVTRALHPTEAMGFQANKPLFVATWNFGLPACEQSLKTLQSGGSLLDAIEQGIRLTEADVTNDSVGIGGRPNAAGVLQLDACIMDGQTQKAGSVAALENYPHPISVARRVMEKTKHVMLVGAGAARFAKEQGFEPAEMPTAQQKKLWQEWQSQQKKERATNHDTIALVGMDAVVTWPAVARRVAWRTRCRVESVIVQSLAVVCTSMVKLVRQVARASVRM